MDCTTGLARSYSEVTGALCLHLRHVDAEDSTELVFKASKWVGVKMLSCWRSSGDFKSMFLERISLIFVF